MKKKMTVTTVIISIIIVALCYYMYQEYIYPIYLKNEKQEKVISLSNSSEVSLRKMNKQTQIYSVEIEIRGQSSSNLSIIVSDSIGIPSQEIKLKKGKIDYIYKSDWYSSECNLNLSSKEKMRGDLTFEYRFFGLQ